MDRARTLRASASDASGASEEERIQVYGLPHVFFLLQPAASCVLLFLCSHGRDCGSYRAPVLHALQARDRFARRKPLSALWEHAAFHIAVVEALRGPCRSTTYIVARRRISCCVPMSQFAVLVVIQEIDRYNGELGYGIRVHCCCACGHGEVLRVCELQALKKHKASTLLGSAVAKAVMAGVLKKGAATADWDVQGLEQDAAAATLQADSLTSVPLPPTIVS